VFADSLNQTGVGDGRPHAARAYDADLSLPLAHCGETSTQQTNIKRLISRFLDRAANEETRVF
jgi:hypothetical protein